jgi:hypothetical protein
MIAEFDFNAVNDVATPPVHPPPSRNSGHCCSSICKSYLTAALPIIGVLSARPVRGKAHWNTSS